MQVQVRDNNVDQALRALKKKLQREGVFREMKLKQHFEKPSEKCGPRVFFFVMLGPAERGWRWNPMSATERCRLSAGFTSSS